MSLNFSNFSNFSSPVYSSPTYDYWKDVGTLNVSTRVEDSVEGRRPNHHLTRLHQDLQLEHLRRENENLRQTISHLIQLLQEQEGRRLYTIELYQLRETIQEIDRIIETLTNQILTRQ